MQPEGRAGCIARERAESGASEIAVVARLLGPLAQLFACLTGSEGRSDKRGYYEALRVSQELPLLKTMHFPAVSKLPKNVRFYAFRASVASARNAC